MCTRATLAEVRELQKAAGILNENDIDYSLDEMLDGEDTVNEKMQIPPCGPMWDGHKAVEGVRWMMQGDKLRRSTCMLPGRQPDFKIDGYSLIPWNDTLEEAVGSVAPCGPGFTAYVTGPKPQDLICMPSNQAPPKNINGKPPQKKAGSPTAPGAPTPQMQAEGIDPAEGSAIMHWVKNMYSKLTMEQFHKLVAIYSDQWKNEKEHFDSVEDFLGELEDSSDPEAIIPIRSLKQYSGY